jgi:hypothetical protein
MAATILRINAEQVSFRKRAGAALIQAIKLASVAAGSF